jgi:hypothetical protein
MDCLGRSRLPRVMAQGILIEAFDHTRRLPLLVKMSHARELHWVDALLPGVRNLLDVHSQTNNQRRK